MEKEPTWREGEDGVFYSGRGELQTLPGSRGGAQQAGTHARQTAEGPPRDMSVYTAQSHGPDQVTQQGECIKNTEKGFKN